MVALISSLAQEATGYGYAILYDIVKGLAMFSDGGDALLIVQAMYDYVAVIGISFALAFALMEILDSAFRTGMGNVSFYQIIMPFMKFIVVYGIIAYGYEIIGMVLSGSNAFLAYIDSYFTTDMFVDTMEAEGVSGLLANVFFVLLPSLISIISQVIAALVIGAQIIMIKVEIYLRAIFLPIAAANMLNSGPNGGSGWRYIKGFIGNIFTLGAILIMIKLVFFVGGDTTQTSFTNMLLDVQDVGGELFAGIFSFLFTSLIGPFSCVGAVSTVKGIIKEAFS